MAANDDNPAPLDLSMRRNNDHNEGINDPPNRNRPRRFPPAPLPPTMGAPRSTSFESYSHSQAHQADAQYFPRGLQPAPGQFFNPENVLNLDPQPKPPVPPTNDIWNRNRNNNYSSNQNYNQTPNRGNININGNNGPLGFGPPWVNPYNNYSHQSAHNSYSINPTFPGSQMPPPLFQFQQDATPTQVHSFAYNFGNGNSPYYEQPRPIYNCGQPGPAFHSQPTHSSYNSWAQNHSAYYREETHGDNGLGGHAPEVISLVSTGSIKIDTDDGDVIFLGYSSSIKIGNEAGNENDRDERSHVLTPQASIQIHELSPEVSIPGPSTNDEEPESQDTGSDAALKRKENVAVSTGSFIPFVSLRRHGGSRIPIEAPVKEPAYRIGVIQFGLRKNAVKHPPAILEEEVAEKSGRSQGNKGITKSGEADAESVKIIPSPLPVQGNKCPVSVPVQKPYGAASRVQIHRPVELRQDVDASSRLVWPRKGRKKPIKWLLIDPDTEKTEIDALMGELDE